MAFGVGMQSSYIADRPGVEYTGVRSRWFRTVKSWVPTALSSPGGQIWRRGRFVSVVSRSEPEVAWSEVCSDFFHGAESFN